MSLLAVALKRIDFSGISVSSRIQTRKNKMSEFRDLRLIAFFLPQFHPIPENDAWWGTGFTEWRNVVKAKPAFSGHYQPHLPADLGFYDLRCQETQIQQATLAKQYGIHGFCYYHYWFNGRRILERPFEQILQSGKPDFPFCLCWANENWTRTWDGGSKELLLEQKYSEDDDRLHILSLLPALRDSRYIRVNGKPLILIYRTELLPNPKRTAEIWRDVAKRNGIGDIYLARVENFTRGIDPKDIGFDAAVEFAPDQFNPGERVFHGRMATTLRRIGLIPKAFSQRPIYRYSSLVNQSRSRPERPYTQFRCVAPSWDNTARRQNDGRIWIGSNPSLFENWLRAIVQQTRARYVGDEQLVFVNAWNEWAEGCHLEPDARWGTAYLQAVQQALSSSRDPGYATVPMKQMVTSHSNSAPGGITRTYWSAMRKLKSLLELARASLRLPI